MVLSIERGDTQPVIIFITSVNAKTVQNDIVAVGNSENHCFTLLLTWFPILSFVSRI